MLPENDDMPDRSVIVTGGAAGIGRAIAEKFVALGAKVAIFDKDRERGDATLAALREIGGHVRFVHGDMRDLATLPSMVDQIVEAFGGIDVLINNAATTGEVASLLELPLSEFIAVIEANLVGTFYLSQLAAREMVKRQVKGTIVNIEAIQTTMPLPGHSAYVASKGGIDALTRSLAIDLADFGIRVNGIQVGCVLSESFAALLGGEPREAPTLLGRMGTPAEIAEVAAFLASSQAGFLTGAVFRADGGRAISRKPDPLL